MLVLLFLGLIFFGFFVYFVYILGAVFRVMIASIKGNGKKGARVSREGLHEYIEKMAKKK